MNIAILHYSVQPVVGGVEAVIQAHATLLLKAGYAVTLIAGAGAKAAIPEGAELILIPEMNSRHAQIIQASQQLELGKLAENFEEITTRLEESLGPILQEMDYVIVHNVFTKHFNLPLTVALGRLVDQGRIGHCIAWCHDFTWTSSHSRSRVHPGYPWDLLRTYRENVTYVTVSRRRQAELAGLFNCSLEQIHVVYDGVDPAELYSLSDEGQTVIDQLELNECDLILLMPVRITQAKNIEFALQVLASLASKDIHPRLVVTGPPDPHDPQDMAYYRSLLDLRRQLNVEQEARFVYSLGLHGDGGDAIDLPLVRQLYRACDALFMPSHREGFGMPILEAGLIGMPIFSTEIPATEEIGGQEVIRFSADESAEQVAELILGWAQKSPTQRLRQRIRKKFTWQAIFNHDILPLLSEGGKA